MNNFQIVYFRSPGTQLVRFALHKSYVTSNTSKNFVNQKNWRVSSIRRVDLVMV